MSRKRLTEADLAALTRQIARAWRTVKTPADAQKVGSDAWDGIDALPPMTQNVRYWVRQAKVSACWRSEFTDYQREDIGGVLYNLSMARLAQRRYERQLDADWHARRKA